MQSLEHNSPNPALPLDAKAEQILSAARDVFLEQGYAATSMDLVAQRARVSKTTLYTRFPSKDELYTAVISAECDRHGMRFRPEMFDGIPVREVLVRIGTRFLDLIWSEPAIRVHQSVVGEAARMPEVARLFHQAGPERAIATLAALFERMARHGLIETDDPAFAAHQFLAAMKGGAHCARELGLCPVPTAAERDAFVAKAVDLFLRGILPAGR